MFLSLKQNLAQKLSRHTKYATLILKNSVQAYKFAEKVNFERLNDQKSDQIINKYFSEHEQYIANFYKKHKQNFLVQESHDREFEEFLIQMETLINKDLERKKTAKKYINDMGKISLQSRESLREVLIYYQLFLSKNGFDSQVLSETLLFLGKLNQSRENFHRIYSDFTHWDFINSYRSYHIIEDLKFGLCNENSFMSAYQIAKSIKGLTLCGYKNTQVADLVFDRILSFLTKEKMNNKFEKFVDTPGAGKYKYNETNLHAEDIFNDENFRKHLFKVTQLNFGEENTQTKLSKNKTDQSDSKNTKIDYDQELLTPIKDIIELLKETKEIQHGLTDSIDNLLDQYYKIEQALLENPELKENPYIKYEVFKLQDKLVEGGYLTIEALNEVTKSKLTAESLDKLKHENIVSVLRDFVLLNFPNLYNEGENRLDLLLENTKQFKDFTANSSRFKINDLSLGETLAVLSDYSKITNVDINGEDYYNDKIVKEFVNKNFMKENKEQIKIKAEYTKLFFNTENFLRNIEPLMYNVINESKNIGALGYIYYAYSNMNIASLKELKLKILNKMSSLLKEPISNTSEEIKYLIMGLAKGEIRNDNVVKIVKKVSQHIKSEEIIKIDDMVKILWGLSVFNLTTSPAFINLLINLSQNSDNLTNYITNQTEFNMYLYQLSVSLKYEAKNFITIPSTLNNLLDVHLNLRDIAFFKIQCGAEHKEIRTVSNEMLIDPVKLVVFNGMQEGIFSKEIQRKYSLAITGLETMDASGSIPFFPDLVFGFYGHKVALFILGKDYITDDPDVNNVPVNGYCHLVKRVLQEKFNTHAVFIPTSQLIKFDIKTVHMDLLYENDGFTNLLEKILSRQLNLSLEDNKVFQVNKYLNHFIKRFSNSETGDLVFQTESSNQLENFMNSLLKVIDLHSELVHTYHASLLEKKVADLKLNLTKNKIYFNSMSENFKLFVNDIVNEITGAKIDYNIFLDSFNKCYDSLNQNKKENIDLVVSSDWMGKRLHVDLIPQSKDIRDKNISVELINNNYMWLGEYNPYNDWELELKASYDNFNYFVENGKNKYLYNSHKLGNRNVPTGIFPHPNRFRKIKTTAFSKKIEAKSDYEYELKSYQNYNQKIVNDEVERNVELTKQLRGSNLSLKVNLLNIKNSLKQNLNDNQIVKFISNFEFIDQLIDEHLYANNDDSSVKVEFLKRDPEAFKNLYKKLTLSTPQYDEYDKFIMREYYNEKKIFDVDPTASKEENRKKMEERMSRKVEENEDNDALSIYSPNNVDYEFNINSVLSSGKIPETDKDMSSDECSSNPEAFLIRKRLMAERNIILLRIIVKVLENDTNTLNEKEEKYLNNLFKKLNDSNLNQIEEVGINSCITKIKLENLTPNDKYALNSLYNVDINEACNNYSLSELALELSHFIDNSTINKLLYHLYEKTVLGNKSTRQIFSVQNKEPTLISNEIKESLWRVSGFLNEDDKLKLKNLLKVKRGKSKFDKIWLQIDEMSLMDFLKTANLNENRLRHLEKWIKRKEKEVENRIELPPENLYLSDTKINQLMERKDKSYRKTILFNIFKVDDLNKIDIKRLSEFINEFCGSLNLFNYSFPQTIRDIFNALEDVPGLYEEDKQLLKSYKLFFEVEDNNPFEYLSVTPVKMQSEKFQRVATSVEEILDEKILNRIRSSNIPFIPAVVDRILKKVEIRK